MGAEIDRGGGFIPPQVLFLGNGINRAYGGGSWEELIERLTVNKNLPAGCQLRLPMPLRAILVTGDTVDQKLREVREVLYGKIASEEHAALLRALLSMGFDHILTANYSYELEMAAQPDWRIEEKTLRKMMRHSETVTHAEVMYLLHTYNEFEWQGRNKRVWHIHGEGRKPDSMILGHYYYANLFKKMSNYIQSQKNRYQRQQERGEPLRINSWVDAFLLGDVYILGFGYDVSEFDLWWLLNRRKHEKADKGRVYFFAPRKKLPPHAIDDKEELLKVLGVEVRDCGVSRPERDEDCQEAFRSFYHRAVSEIRALTERNAQRPQS